MPTDIFRTRRLLAPALAAAALAILPGALAPASSFAQGSREVEEIAPAWFTVAAATADMRCGNTSRFYAVAELTRGQVIRVDGRASERTSDGDVAWSRVVYPSNVPVFVVAGDAEPAGESFVRLTRASRMRAWSLGTGVAGSWRSVFDPEVPEGRLLPLIEVVRDDAGAVAGYRVEAPTPPNAAHPARGFVRTDALRPASPAEIRAHLGTAEPEPESQREAQTTPATEPETTQPAPTTSGTVEPTADPAAESDNEAPAATGTEPPAETDADSQPEPAEPPLEVVAREVEGLPTPSELRDLEGAFDRLRTLPRAEQDAALDELVAEYRRTREALDLSVPGAPGVAVSLERRIQWLELRQRTRDERIALLRELGEVDQRIQASADRAEAWRAGRGFDLVGRVERSSIYNGINLPRMYRLVADDPVAGRRTVGYIRASSDGPDLTRLVGQIVGVRGTAVRDAQLGLLLIDPRDVEIAPR